MQLVADTNIWLRIADDQAIQHSAAKGAVRHLLAARSEIFLTPQNLVEFWAVATRPREANGLGWTIDDTDNELRNLRGQFALLPENNAIFQTWLDLVRSCRITGKRVHDARVAAQMMVHNIPRILTFNTHDFRQFPAITALTCQEALLIG